MRSWLLPIALALLVLGSRAGAQQTCGDLDFDGDVDSDDALVLRHELDTSAPLSLLQSLSCDVITEVRDPGLQPDPDDLAGACSMADAAVMTRHESGLSPAPVPVCALGANTDCCAGHAGVGCNVASTVSCVCAQDPSCCTADWDSTCASLACNTACEPNCSAGSDYCAGACRNVQTDPAHCGSCGVTCTNPHGSTQCAGGACSPTCSLGWGTCDSNPQNGCETSFDTNPTCPGTFLGPIDGENTSLQMTRTGRGEVQFYVQVQDTGTCFSDTTSLNARLTSPPGSNYNLRLTCFNCPGSGAPPSVQSNAPAGAIDVLNAGAFDDCNQDETFYLVIAVLYASGSSCGDWSLELRGENSDVSRLCGADD